MLWTVRLDILLELPHVPWLLEPISTVVVAATTYRFDLLWGEGVFCRSEVTIPYNLSIHS